MTKQTMMRYAGRSSWTKEGDCGREGCDSGAMEIVDEEDTIERGKDDAIEDGAI